MKREQGKGERKKVDGKVKGKKLSEKLPTLTEAEETGGEDGGAEESEEDRATDELETCLLSLWTKPLANAVQSHLQISEKRRGRRKRHALNLALDCMANSILCM